MHFTDPRTNRPYGGGDHGLRVLVIATPHPACQLIDLTGAAVKATEYEVLTCSVYFHQTSPTIRITNPTVRSLAVGDPSPVPDPEGATRDARSEMMRSPSGILFALHVVSVVHGILSPSPRPLS